MTEIIPGNYVIRCVLIDSETVVNNEGVRQLEVYPDHWLIAPAEQRFEVVDTNQSSLVLRSNDQTYFANCRMAGDQLMIHLARENCRQTVSIEASLLSTAATA